MASNQDKHAHLLRMRLRYTLAYLIVWIAGYSMLFYLAYTNFISYSALTAITLIFLFSVPAFIIAINAYFKRKLRLTWKEALLH